MPASTSKYSLSDLAARFGLELRGDGDLVIQGVSTLAAAGPAEITFLANRSYRKHLPDTQAGAVILQEEDAENCPSSCLLTPNPYLAYARLAVLFDPRPQAEPGIHASAVISDSARLGKDVHIGAQVVIGDDCIIGDGCAIGPGTVLEANCRLGACCRLHANVTLGHGVRLGERTVIHPGAVIGADGFGIAFATDHWEKVPQLGSVVIGDDCEIGANTCIDRGASGDAGSCRIGKYCLLGGGAGISGHVEIADHTTITGRSQITRSITEPGTHWSGTLPSSPVREWNRNIARLRKLDDLARKVQTLENQIGKLIKDGK
jgi:UDP-3-O-[3-hydroxymyristoyl] glucosamine N-acyltransferase